MSGLRNPNQPSQSTFLPTDYVRGKSQSRANLIALLLFGAVLIGVVGAFFLNTNRMRGVLDREEQVDEQTKRAAEHLDQLRTLRVQREEMIESAELVTALIENVPRSVLLAELVRAMPEGLVFTELALEGERIKVAPTPTPASGVNRRPTTKSIAPRVQVGKDDAGEKSKVAPPRFRHRLVLTGLATENNAVADYLAKLKRSPLLSGVELMFITETTVDEVELRKFEMTMVLRRDADVHAVAEAVETTLLNENAFGNLGGSNAPDPGSFANAPTSDE